MYADARDQGYRLTMHCDADQENSVAHIWQCVGDIGVERIDHGVNCLEDEELVEEIKRRGLGLTVCPISNAYVTDGTKAAAIKTMLGRGLRVTLNSDDPAYFPGYVADNFHRVHSEIGLSREEVVRLVRNSFEISWLDDASRAEYLSRVDACVEAS